MNAEALVGTILGTCKLQKLIGQGGMGAVFLAQQSHPPRQVAVKVLLPVTPLAQRQQAAFLESFRRETLVTASLQHPNIIPVYEYGEQSGLAYLIMPYLDGGSLRDELEQSGQLPLPKIIDYLSQMAEALAVAHRQGIVHRDIKPANMMKTREGRLVLTDFGLVKIIAEGQWTQAQITGMGGLVGTPDYMAPEQVLGGQIDARADLYALGVILYQMVTGTVPFKADMAMQVAMQHVHAAPLSPRSLRPDLPVAAEQVVLRALAKNPHERYAHVQELAQAFRKAVEDQPGPVIAAPLAMGKAMGTPSLTRRGLLDPVWRNNGNTPLPASDDATQKVRTTPLMTNAQGTLDADHGLTKADLPSPAFSGLFAPKKNVPLTSAGLLPQSSPPLPASNASNINPYTPPPAPEWSGANNGQATSATGYLSQMPSLLPATPTGTLDLGASGIYMPSHGVTGALMPPGMERPTSTMKLTQAVKVVQVPVAGQPGRYRTGVLPVFPAAPEPEQQPLPYAEKITELNAFIQKNIKKLVLVAVALLLLFSSSLLWLNHVASDQAAKNALRLAATPNLVATATMAVQATAQANTILTDDLSEDMHNWPVSTGKNPVFVFKDGAYHIAPNDSTHSGIALLPDEVFSSPLVYTISSQEINGDDQSIYNKFGMVMRYNSQQKNGKLVTTFYSFDVINLKNGEYEFRKYDDSYGPNVNPYTMLWSHTFGPEYHTGHGKNTFAVMMNKDKFTFTVNGKQVGTTEDNTLTNGQIGLFVNLNGTEVAFSNLILTYS
ncbi:MAG TPA: serine/threonine-protein kinase [Ktedonobacteraceae bacterium]|nr:serine/threonine-protein kinase [Ktedonobacteraceae bacterium]